MISSHRSATVAALSAVRQHDEDRAPYHSSRWGGQLRCSRRCIARQATARPFKASQVEFDTAGRSGRRARPRYPGRGSDGGVSLSPRSKAHLIAGQAIAGGYLRTIKLTTALPHEDKETAVCFLLPNQADTVPDVAFDFAFNVKHLALVNQEQPHYVDRNGIAAYECSGFDVTIRNVPS